MGRIVAVVLCLAALAACGSNAPRPTYPAASPSASVHSGEPSAGAPAPADPSPGKGVPAVGSTILLMATTAGNEYHYITNRDGEAWIEAVADDDPDARFLVEAPLNGGDGKRRCVSLRAAELPVRYLRHRNSEVFVDAQTGDELFRNDATWCVDVVATGIRLATAAFPDTYLRHSAYRLRIDSGGGPFVDDSTWSWLSAA
ncbi:hypothetical protein Val02_23940 [Virgisporangium aliadipatigenens]|uniref:Alpha-L-arabinofuranosidase B arabinose-binding domain-containing protein n=1 Tax=Virgisporangium aliadipatigenens TaxID=741659 RepID=A0A8J4DQA3_9ACTN|nr:AbfB domain-containing protein [Virgisporangium aliadipatigenens]GIJ45508.1 hypothetical protein Val02_23940 [Virgisporangium aliadipatigenens]